MKVNYEKILELNKNSLSHNGDQLSCYYLIQIGVENFLRGEHLTDNYMEFLIQLGILEETQDEKKKIVKPFNFMGNDGPQGN